MSGAHQDPFLDQALTEVEELMVARGNLTATTGGATPLIIDLVNKKIKEMRLRCTDASHVLSLDEFRRLSDVYQQIASNGNAGAAGIVDVGSFFQDKIMQMVDSHPSTLKSDAPRKSALELFEDLEFWLALQTLVGVIFVPGNCITHAIRYIISFNVAACPIDGVTIPGSLRVVDIGAKLMRALPQHHHWTILRVVNSHLMGLTMADDQRGDGHAQISAQSAVVGDGGIPLAGALAPELTTAKNTHIKVHWDIRHPCCYCCS